MRWLLVEDERGTAAVEMIVLIPVYVLLLMGLFALGEMSMARQALAQAGRFHLWAGRANFTDDQVGRGFFGPYHGSYSSEALSGDNNRWTLDKANVEPKTIDLGDGTVQEGALAGNPGADAVEIAHRALKNDMDPRTPGPAGEGYPVNQQAIDTYGSGQIALQQRVIKCKWQHTGITFGIAPEITWRGRLLVWNPGHSRGEFQDGKQHHWVAHSALRPAGHMFEPAAWSGGNKNRYLSPEKTTPGGSPTATQPLKVRNDAGNKRDPGVWDVNARINGSIPAEHTFYKSRGP